LLRLIRKSRGNRADTENDRNPVAKVDILGSSISIEEFPVLKSRCIVYTDCRQPAHHYSGSDRRPQWSCRRIGPDHFSTRLVSATDGDLHHQRCRHCRPLQSSFSWYAGGSESSTGVMRFSYHRCASARRSLLSRQGQVWPTKHVYQGRSGIKVEILPVVFKKGITDPNSEPFVLYLPEKQTWEDGFARNHQQWLSIKNASERTGGNFIPPIKVLKHIRSLFGLNAVSFHIEYLLYFIADAIFVGGPADYVASVLRKMLAATATYSRLRSGKPKTGGSSMS
jgi:hypothetical protein